MPAWRKRGISSHILSEPHFPQNNWELLLLLSTFVNSAVAGSHLPNYRFTSTCSQNVLLGTGQLWADMSLGHAFRDHLPETTLPRTFFCTMVWYCYRKINFFPEKEVRDVNLMPWKQALFSFLTYGFIFRSIEGEMKISVPVANEQRSKEEMRYFSYVKAILLLIYVSLPSSAIQCYSATANTSVWAQSGDGWKS